MNRVEKKCVREIALNGQFLEISNPFLGSITILKLCQWLTLFATHNEGKNKVLPQIDFDAFSCMNKPIQDTDESFKQTILQSTWRWHFLSFIPNICIWKRHTVKNIKIVTFFPMVFYFYGAITKNKWLYNATERKDEKRFNFIHLNGIFPSKNKRFYPLQRH